MPLPIPNLDDRNFDQLTAEAVALIPRNLPQWTDYNPSDPGITLIELFAFLLEAAIYQINRVPDRSLLAFASLVGVTPLAGETTTQTLLRAQQAAAARTSAYTQSDFERYALQVGVLQLTVQSVAGIIVTVAPFNTTLAYPVGTVASGASGTTILNAAIAAGATGLKQITVADASFAASLQAGAAITITPIGRARASMQVALRDTSTYPVYEFVQVVIVPSTAPNAAGTALRQSVYQILRGLCPIATGIRVREATYISLSIVAKVVADLGSRVSAAVIQQNVATAVTTFLDPLVGGPDGQGWPFGRSVFRSELYQVIQNVTGVDHVAELLLNGDELVSEIALRDATSLVSLLPANLQVVVTGQ